MGRKKPEKINVARVNRYIQALCGIYSRVARKLGVDRSYVSRVAKGERHSPKIEEALTREFKQVQGNGT
jgi:transcriptional regulator with XRE-family HTH domain